MSVVYPFPSFSHNYAHSHCSFSLSHGGSKRLRCEYLPFLHLPVSSVLTRLRSFLSLILFQMAWTVSVSPFPTTLRSFVVVHSLHISVLVSTSHPFIYFHVYHTVSIACLYWIYKHALSNTHIMYYLGKPPLDLY